MLSPAKLTLWTALLATPLLGQPNVPAKVGANQGAGPHNPQELAAFIDSFFTPKMEKLKIPGAVFSGRLKMGRCSIARGTVSPMWSGASRLIPRRRRFISAQSASCSPPRH